MRAEIEHSDLGVSEELFQAQYGRLPQEEHPTEGPVLDVVNALNRNRDDYLRAGEKIGEKRIQTKDWVAANFPGQTALFLTRPFEWQGLPEEVQGRVAEWMAKVIVEVYGEEYPLPNKYADFNQRGIQSHSLLPYIGLIGPRELDRNGLLYENPDLLIDSELTPVATSALLLGDKGFAELGRTARSPHFEGFEGAALSLERFYDWASNRHRLMEVVHTLSSDIRAAAAHGQNPSSGAVQKLILKDLGLRVRLAAPLYNVNGLEPFLSVVRPRDLKKWRKDNQYKTIYTPPGRHMDLIRALWQHQLGVEPYLSTGLSGDIHDLGIATYNGDEVYSSIEVLDGQKSAQLSAAERNNTHRLEDAAKELESKAPSVLVKIDAEEPGAVATQQFFRDRGYVICGVEPGYDEQYLAVKGSNGTTHYELKRHKAPVTIYMAKLGRVVRNGRLEYVQAYYPSPEDARGNDLYGEKLRQELLRVDQRIRR